MAVTRYRHRPNIPTPTTSGSTGRSAGRTDVVDVLPNPESLLRLAGAVLVEAHDEWQVSDRRYLGLDVLGRCRIRPVTDTADTQEVATEPTIPVLRDGDTLVTAPH